MTDFPEFLRHQANRLLSDIISHDRVGDIKLVVVDELHMVSYDTRGCTLELFLAKLLFHTERGVVRGHGLFDALAGLTV